MSAKTTSVLIVSLFLLCSFTVIFANTSDAAPYEYTEESITIDFENGDYKNISNVTKRLVSMVLHAFGVDEERLYSNDGPFESQFKVKAIMKNVNYTIGYKGFWNGSVQTIDYVNILKADFEIELTARYDGAEFKVANTDYITGKGYEEYVSALSVEFNKGDNITFIGHIDGGMHTRIGSEYYFNDSLGYLNTRNALVSNVYDAIDGGIVKVGGKTFDFDYSTKQQVTTITENDFGKDAAKVKIGDMFKTVAHAPQINKMDYSLAIKVDGESKDVKVDIEKAKKEISREHTSDPTEVTFLSESDIEEMMDMMISVTQLGLVDGLDGKTEKEVNQVVEANGGKLSKDVGFFDGKADKVDRSAGGNNNENITVMLYIIFAVIIALIIIIALFVWFVRYRK